MKRALDQKHIHVGKNQEFQVKNEGETWEQKLDLGCKTGTNLAYKIATKTYNTVWHCPCKRHHDNKVKKSNTSSLLLLNPFKAVPQYPKALTKKC